MVKPGPKEATKEKNLTTNCTTKIVARTIVAVVTLAGIPVVRGSLDLGLDVKGKAHHSNHKLETNDVRKVSVKKHMEKMGAEAKAEIVVLGMH